jgi:hypothetical protein
LHGVKRVTDLDTGANVPVADDRFRVTLAPGWGKILRYE